MFASREFERRCVEGLRFVFLRDHPRPIAGAAHRAQRLALAALIAGASQLAFAAITPTGDVIPTPVPAVVTGTVIIGNTAVGTLTVDTGSTLTAGGFSLGNNATPANGTVSIIGTASGPQTTVNLLGPASTATSVPSPLQLGRWGVGLLTVSSGAIMNVGLSGGSPSTTCLQSNNCNVFIGGSAGATGTLTLTGAGTTANVAAGMLVGEAFVGSVAANGFNLGTPGQNASGTIQIQNGATLNSTFTQLGFVPTGFAELGTEHATGHVVVDGTGSTWNIAANTVANAPATLTIGRDVRGTGIVEVTNNAQLNVAGSSAAISVGERGTGTLQIGSGGQATAANVNVGNQATGQGILVIDTAGALTARQLTVGVGATGNGSVTIVGTGAGNPTQTIVNLTGPASGSDLRNPLAVGAWGTGAMTVSNGAIVNAAINGGVPNPNCTSGLCNNFIGNAAGSTASLTLTGAGTTINAAGGFVVGNAAVFTQAHDGFTFGTPGGTTNATLLVQNGATLNTYQATVANGAGGGAPLGTEHTNAQATVDGAGSTWNIVRNAVTGTQAQLTVGRTANATGQVDVTNGGVITITGSRPNPLTDNTTPGIAMGGTVGTAGGTATINVTGSGSAIVINGDTGFINLSRNAGNATLNITNGGQVFGGTPNGLVNLNVARMGSTGTLNVGGPGSQLTLSGVCGINTGCDGNGAFINAGRDTGSQAFINVTGGGKILVTDGGQAANNGMTGIFLGRDAGSSGTMLISGAGSSVTVEQTGAGTTNPGIVIGRAGTGDVTVTNNGSLAVVGTLERTLVVGNAIGGTSLGGVGTLTVSNGADVNVSWFAVGNNSTTGPNGGQGTMTVDNATVHIDGITINPNNGNVTGGGFRVGRGPGSVGELNLQNNAHITINTPTTTPEIYVGGTGVSPGGTGTVNMSGGSTVAFTGTGATPRVVIGHSGDGTWNMTGAGTKLTLPNDGSVILGSTATGNGTLAMTGGAAIQTGSMNVGASGGGAVSMVGATLNVAGNLIVGDAGTATFAQSGGTNTIGGQLIIGNQATGDGTYQASNGATVALTGTSTTAKAIVGNAGTGALTLESGSTMTLASGGSMIVGATATGSGTVFVDSTSSIQAGSLIGLGHDGTTSTDGKGKLIVDGSVTATNLFIGQNGCLAGNGVVNANVTMNGVTGSIGACPPEPPPPILITTLGAPGIIPTGILNPGRSPGRIVINGGFDFISGEIVLEIESDGHGGFIVDELVFSGIAPIDLTNAVIEFQFLGNTDPNAFAASGLWDLDTFFKINTNAGSGFAAGSDAPISVGLNETLDQIFAQAIFEASSENFVLQNFTFTPEGGVGEEFVAIPAITVPEPAPWMLMLGALLLLYLARTRRLTVIPRRR